MNKEISMLQYEQLKRRDPHEAIRAMLEGRVYDAPVALVEQHRLNHQARTRDRDFAQNLAAHQEAPRLRFRNGD